MDFFDGRQREKTGFGNGAPPHCHFRREIAGVLRGSKTFILVRILCLCMHLFMGRCLCAFKVFFLGLLVRFRAFSRYLNTIFRFSDCLGVLYRDVGL